MNTFLQTLFNIVRTYSEIVRTCSDIVEPEYTSGAQNPRYKHLSIKYYYQFAEIFA